MKPNKINQQNTDKAKNNVPKQININFSLDLKEEPNLLNDVSEEIRFKELISVLESVNAEYILLKKIQYKTKNQMRSHKHYQYLQELTKSLLKNYLQDIHIVKKKFMNLSKLKEKVKLVNKNVKLNTEKILFSIAEKCVSMLNLKIFPVYNAVILSIVSRLNLLISYNSIYES